MYKIIICGLILILLVIIIKNTTETFDETGTEFLPVGYKRYGLRGEPVMNNTLDDCYFDQYKCYTSGFYPYTKEYHKKMNELTQV